MDDNFILNNQGKEELPHNSEQSDYENLVSRLQEISSIIALLKKTISR